MADERRYAVVGTGARASMYIEALAGEYPGEIVAWRNGVRMSRTRYEVRPVGRLEMLTLTICSLREML